MPSVRCPRKVPRYNLESEIGACDRDNLEDETSSSSSSEEEEEDMQCSSLIKGKAKLVNKLTHKKKGLGKVKKGVGKPLNIDPRALSFTKRKNILRRLVKRQKIHPKKRPWKQYYNEREQEYKMLKKTELVWKHRYVGYTYIIPEKLSDSIIFWKLYSMIQVDRRFDLPRKTNQQLDEYIDLLETFQMIQNQHVYSDKEYMAILDEEQEMDELADEVDKEFDRQIMEEKYGQKTQYEPEEEEGEEEEEFNEEEETMTVAEFLKKQEELDE